MSWLIYTSDVDVPQVKVCYLLRKSTNIEWEDKGCSAIKLNVGKWIIVCDFLSEMIVSC